MHGSVTGFEHSILQKEAKMLQQPIPLEMLTTTMQVEKRCKKMIKRFSKLTTPVNPFGLRILKKRAAETLLLAIGTFATLLFSGCASGGFVDTTDQKDDTFGMSEVAEDSAFVDWTKPARNQPGHQAPEFGGRGEP
jgi:hypothetical protein